MKYRLIWFIKDSLLALDFSHHGVARVAGDCIVRAIKEETDVDAHNKTDFQEQQYTEPMTIEEARSFILGEGRKAVGSDVERCLGLSLEDSDNEKVLFDDPIVY